MVGLAAPPSGAARFFSAGELAIGTRRAQLKFAKLDTAEKEHLGMRFGRIRCRG